MTNTKNKADQGGDPFEGAEVIFQYTRKQAIEDGVLVDVSEIAREAGIPRPMAVTERVWSEVITPSERAEQEGQSETGRLWDVVYLLRTALQEVRTHGDTIHYKVLVRDGKRARGVKLKAVCGAGDHGEFVGTIMMPEED